MTRRRPRAGGRAGTRRVASSARRASAKPPRPTKGLVPRVGLGIDRHPFAPGRRLVLGGVVIPGANGLQGHSDADVLTHAICDAILGALGLPDLGIRFPASAPRWRGRRSLFFLRDIVKAMRSRRYAIGNLDVVVLAEQPRLRPHLAPMRAVLARVIGCDPAQVSIKPKRGEGLGFVGRGEGIEVHAAVLLLASP
ncbi:MAG TPA: 2-C-methyl-D-erythritol 2,4-cyclodiphosphate synthase [Verrucomicrobiae bacterium]|nr:2-C-methyl-D-erythritol 2,4-cyclodiphosphate synthase [Verrucomicrobiae bacterium]